MVNYKLIGRLCLSIHFIWLPLHQQFELGICHTNENWTPLFWFLTRNLKTSELYFFDACILTNTHIYFPFKYKCVCVCVCVCERERESELTYHQQTVAHCSRKHLYWPCLLLCKHPGWEFKSTKYRFTMSQTSLFCYLDNGINWESGCIVWLLIFLK